MYLLLYWVTIILTTFFNFHSFIRPTLSSLLHRAPCLLGRENRHDGRRHHPRGGTVHHAAGSQRPDTHGEFQPCEAAIFRQGGFCRADDLQVLSRQRQATATATLWRRWVSHEYHMRVWWVSHGILWVSHGHILQQEIVLDKYQTTLDTICTFFQFVLTKHVFKSSDMISVKKC